MKMHEKVPVNPFARQDCPKFGYGCIFCGDCSYGDYWKCKEEYVYEYERYKEKLKLFFSCNDKIKIGV